MQVIQMARTCAPQRNFKLKQQDSMAHLFEQMLPKPSAGGDKEPWELSVFVGEDIK